MKCVALALFSVSVLMIVPANAHGQSIKNQMAAINTEAAPFLAVREANRKTFADLSQQLDDINLGNAALAKGATQYKADLAEYQMDIDAFDQAGAAQDKAVDAHNAHKCTYSQGSNACDRYNQEKNRLDAVHQQLIDQQASLASRKANLAATADKFRELQKIISDKTEKYMVAQKAYNAQNEENEAKL
ncbi:MAG TPA: hypothetical protein VMV39_02505, partial [Terracidiphilus sp.]|nr:hypothetical protein [Terracidiphilus sp.]